MSILKVRVRQASDAAKDIRYFELESVDGKPLPEFSPGSHIDVRLAGGLVRQYSLCNAAGDTGYAIAVKREPESRGGSRFMHDSLKAGDILEIGAPRNNFALREDARHYVLIAGGIGITPLLSMANRLHDIGASFEVQYFTRSIEHTAFHDVLSSGPFSGRVHFHYGLDAGQVSEYLSRHLAEPRKDSHLYLCGPRPFMDLVESLALAAWPAEAVHLEYFAADQGALAAPKDSFTIQLSRTGTVIDVPAEMSIVQALARHDIYLDTSCEQGVCGTCVTGVLEGEPDHRDAYLTDAERKSGGKICPCVSRSKSACLVLDL